MAIPFRPPSQNSDTARDHYLRIENLLRELLTLLSRMPSWMNGDLSSYSNNGINISPQTVPPAQSLEERDRLWVQQQQHSIRMFHRRRLRERQQQERREQQEEVPEEEQELEPQQQQVLLPDLVSSCGPTVRQQPPPPSQSPSPPPPPPPPSSQQRPEQQQSAVDDDKFVDAVKLQVAVCPTCYYGKERKLKVIGVAKLDGDGKPIRWSTHRDDEELLVIEDKSTKVKRRIMSLLQPSKIESSVLTAMFVIIGWKMFIKQ